MAMLRVSSGPAEGQRLECTGEVVIGREGADLVIDDDQMSRRHAAVRRGSAGVEIEDLGSLNGTFVDGQRISGVVTLTASASVRLGETNFTLEVAPGDLPVADPQRTAPRDTPIADVGERTVVRDVPVIDVPERTVVRETPVAGAGASGAPPAPASDTPPPPASDTPRP